MESTNIFQRILAAIFKWFVKRRVRKLAQGIDPDFKLDFDSLPEAEVDAPDEITAKSETDAFLKGL